MPIVCWSWILRRRQWSAQSRYLLARSRKAARLTANGRTLVVAGMGDGSMHVVDTGTGAVASYDLPGRAVQATVLPDASAAFVTVYHPRQIAKLDLVSKQLSIFDLPKGAVEPMQIYPARRAPMDRRSAVWWTAIPQATSSTS